MRLIKLLLLASGAALLLPSPPDTPAAQGQAQAEVSPFAMISSASLAFADAASFCERQPGVCQTAGYVAAKLEAKAKYSVKLAYEWANDARNPEAGPVTVATVKTDKAVAGPAPAASLSKVQADLLTTQSTTVADGAVPPESQSTLKLEDLIPEWRGPVTQKKKQS